MQHYTIEPTGVIEKPYGWGIQDPEKYHVHHCIKHGNVYALKEGVTMEEIQNPTFTLVPVECCKITMECEKMALAEAEAAAEAEAPAEEEVPAEATGE